MCNANYNQALNDQVWAAGKGGGPGLRAPHGAVSVIEVVKGEINATVRVYPDGVRVGCTFLTMEAARRIAEMIRSEAV